MALIFKRLPLIDLKSMSGRDSWYRIDRTQRKCSCPVKGHCKHLDALGIYEQKQFTPRTHPSFSQAMSAVIKATRIRRPLEAIYWLLYLDTFQDTPKATRKASRIRIARRLAVMSAEDGLSASVQAKVTVNYNMLAKLETPILYHCAEIVRICKLPNWWDLSSGQDFIRESLVGTRRWQPIGFKMSEDEVKIAIEKAIDLQDRIEMMGAINCMGKVGMGSTKQAEFLMQMAGKYNNERAAAFAQVHLSAKSVHSGDNNVLSHAAWHLAGGWSSVWESIDPVTMGEVHDLVEQAKAMWQNPKPIAGYYCDGVHCAGNDRRLAGTFNDMNALCLAYVHYNGVMDPANQKWLPSFFPLDGLNYKLVTDVRTAPGK